MKTRQRPGGGRCSIGGGRRTLGRRAIFPESSRLANGTRRRESPVTLRCCLVAGTLPRIASTEMESLISRRLLPPSNDPRTPPRKPRLPRRCFRGDRDGSRRVVPRLLPATATRRAIIQYRVLKRDVARRQRDVRRPERFGRTLHQQRLWDRADRERFLGALGPAGAERLVNAHHDRTKPLSKTIDTHPTARRPARPRDTTTLRGP